VLRTERLDIRPLQRSDLDGLHRMYGDEETMRYSGGSGGARTRAQTSAGLDRMIGHQDEYGFGMYALVDRDSGEMVGECGLVHVELKLPEVELAYYVVRDRWGRGYATEAARACLDHGFADLGLDRIIAIAWPENGASHRVMEKAGMTYEGTGTYYGREMVRYAAELPWPPDGDAGSRG
jgi:RimJ/RimL family protein N-acetyltransferase